MVGRDAPACTTGTRCPGQRLATRLILASCLTAIVPSPAAGQIRADPDALAQAAPALVERLRHDPYAYFRFVNRAWIARTCSALAEDARDVPSVRLHGDAHVEQFAVTADAWGLDDFDDSARGPAVVDIVRFLGSVDLAARAHGWTARRDALFTRFFDGYRRGLSNPDDNGPKPAIVTRLRTGPTRTREAFLAWGDSLMEPMSAADRAAVVAGLLGFATVLARVPPARSPHYLDLVQAGWLHMGIGSASSPKVLMRVQGPSSSPADDELLEAKRLGEFSGLSCIQTQPVETTLRTVMGAQHIGRLKYRILMALPQSMPPLSASTDQPLRRWWIRSWDPTYREVTIADLQSVDELAGLAYDVGVQLAEGSLHEEPPDRAGPLRQKSVRMLGTGEGRIRAGAVALVDELMAGWQELTAARE